MTASKESTLQRIYSAFERDPDFPFPRERVLALREEVERLATRIASLQAEQQRTPILPEFSAFLEWYGKRVRDIQNLEGKALRAALQDLGVRITIQPGGELRIISRLPVPYQDIRNPATLAHAAINPTGKSSATIPSSNPTKPDHTRLSAAPCSQATVFLDIAA